MTPIELKIGTKIRYKNCKDNHKPKLMIEEEMRQNFHEEREDL